MKYDFDKYVERRGTLSKKWDNLKNDFGRDDLLSMWIADMDFESPQEIREAIKNKTDEGVLGYTIISDTLRDAVINWERTHHNWNFKREDMTWAYGVVTGLCFAVEAFTKPGDSVIIQTPVYHPFHCAIKDAGRHIAANPLKRENGRYTMDFEHLESIITPTCRTLILCSPHNPVARVWTREELDKLAEIAERRDLLVISDEIHHDLVFSDAHHTCFSSILGMDKRTVTFIAPSKTFNIAGMKSSVAVIPNERLRGIYNSVADRFHLNSLSILGAAAMEAAYSKCGEWFAELLKYLEGNRDFTESFIRENMPKVKLDHPEGTYIFWLDFRAYGFDNEKLVDFLINEAHVALDPGLWFGPDGDGFARINTATTRQQLAEGLSRISKALKKYD